MSCGVAGMIWSSPLATPRHLNLNDETRICAPRVLPSVCMLMAMMCDGNYNDEGILQTV